MNEGDSAITLYARNCVTSFSREERLSVSRAREGGLEPRIYIDDPAGSGQSTFYARVSRRSSRENQFRLQEGEKRETHNHFENDLTFSSN